MGKLLLLILVPIIALTAIIAVSIIRTNQSTIIPPTSLPQDNPGATPFEAEVKEVASIAPINQTNPSTSALPQVVGGVEGNHRANIMLTDVIVETPNAFQIKVGYEPENISIVKVSQGNLWSESNILQSIINENEKNIKYAAGQGFNGETTNGKILLQIEYISKNNTEPKFWIYPESMLGYLNQSELSNIAPSNITITYSK